MRVLLAVLCALCVLVGLFHVWAIVEMVRQGTAIDVTSPENAGSLIVIALYFILPAIAWAMRQRAPSWLTLALVAVPLALFFMMAEFKFRLVSS